MNFDNNNFEIAAKSVINIGKAYGVNEELFQRFYRNCAKLIVLFIINATGGNIKNSDVWLFNYCLNTKKTQHEITEAIVSFFGSPENVDEMYNNIRDFLKGEDSVITCMVDVWIKNPSVVPKEQVENAINEILQCFFVWSDVWESVAMANKMYREFTSVKLEFFYSEINFIVNGLGLKLIKDNKRRYKKIQHEVKRFQ